MKLLKQILEDLAFAVQVRGDLVQGRLAKYSRLEAEEALEFVGLLMVFSRQLHLALASDAVLDRCFQAFKNEGSQPDLPSPGPKLNRIFKISEFLADYAQLQPKKGVCSRRL